MKVGEFRLKLYPKDFELVRSFYVTVLEFKVTHEWNRDSDDRGTMFAVGNTTLELLSPEDGAGNIGVGLSLEVPDVKTLWEKFKNESYVTHGLRHNSWGDSSFQISDPEGLKISLFTKD